MSETTLLVQRFKTSKNIKDTILRLKSLNSPNMIKDPCLEVSKNLKSPSLQVKPSLLRLWDLELEFITSVER